MTRTGWNSPYRNFQVPRLIDSKTAASGVLLALFLFTVACRGNPFDVEDVVEIIDSAGYRVSESTQEGVPFVWQDKGLRVDVNGEPVVIFRYKHPTIVKSVKRDNLEEGIIAITQILGKGSGLWEVDRSLGEDLYYKNGRILVFFGGHADTDALRTASISSANSA